MKILKLNFPSTGSEKKILHRRLLKIPKGLFGGVIALLVAALVFIILSSFNIKKVALSANDFVCAISSDIKKTINLEGKSTLLVNGSKVESDLKSKFICLESVKVTSNLPDEVDLEIKERLPAVLVKPLKIDTSILEQLAKNSEATVSSETARISTSAENSIFFTNNEPVDPETYISDMQGMVYSKVDSYVNKGRTEYLSSPTIYVLNDEVEVGKGIGEGRVQNISRILDELKKLEIYPVRVNLFEDNLFMDIGERRIIFTLSKPVERQVISLQLILQKAKIESKQVVKIDLRFDKPVVVYSTVKKP